MIILASCQQHNNAPSNAQNNSQSNSQQPVVENQLSDDAPVNELILGDWYLDTAKTYQPSATFNSDGTFSYLHYSGEYSIDPSIKNLDFLNWHTKSGDTDMDPKSFAFLGQGQPLQTKGQMWYVDSNRLVIKWYEDADSWIANYTRIAPQKGDLYHQLMNTSWNYVSGKGGDRFDQIKSITFLSDDTGEQLEMVYEENNRSRLFTFRIDEDNKGFYIGDDYTIGPISWGVNDDQWELIDENTMYFCGYKLTKSK